MNMRITNWRRGRLIRMTAGCVILLFFLYALNNWSSENILKENLKYEPVFLSKLDLTPHGNVYPVLGKGESFSSYVFTKKKSQIEYGPVICPSYLKNALIPLSKGIAHSCCFLDICS